MSQSVICRDPEVMGGTLVFCGTRVPVQTLIEYLEAGDSIDEFLEGFPSVTREQVVGYLKAREE
jgi:uncharacterized protein (DUF433 family)